MSQKTSIAPDIVIWCVSGIHRGVAVVNLDPHSPGSRSAVTESVMCASENYYAECVVGRPGSGIHRGRGGAPVSSRSVLCRVMRHRSPWQARLRLMTRRAMRRGLAASRPRGAPTRGALMGSQVPAPGGPVRNRESASLEGVVGVDQRRLDALALRRTHRTVAHNRVGHGSIPAARRRDPDLGQEAGTGS